MAMTFGAFQKARQENEADAANWQGKMVKERTSERETKINDAVTRLEKKFDQMITEVKILSGILTGLWGFVQPWIRLP